jgi:hypothetical protein
VTARDRTVIMIVCVLAAVVGGWLLVIQPKRGEASKLGTQITAAQAQLATARGEIAAGDAARSAFASNYTELVRLGEAVPQDDDVPSLIYELQSAASGARVDFRSLQLTPGAGSPAPTSGSGATSAPPPGVTVGPAGFPSEVFTFIFRGNFFRLANFFERVDRFVIATNTHVSVSGRLMTLNSINLGAASTGFPEIDATISATTYLVPASEGLTAGATPSGPGASGSTSPVSTSGASSSAAPAVVTPPVP